MTRLRDRTTGQVVCESLAVADTVWKRTRGLIGRPPLRPGEGLLIAPCQGVHMWFMRYAIDVVFVDAAGRVVALRPRLRPWRLTRIYPNAAAVYELPAGTIEARGVAPGHTLAVEDAP